MWIENKNSYRIKQVVCAILGLCVALMFLWTLEIRQEVVRANEIAEAQEELSDKVFRFHILANSDSEKDQALKLAVRDRILRYMEDSFAGEEMTMQVTKDWAGSHLDELEQEAQQVIWGNGYDYTVRAAVEKCYFPDRRYGEILFPKGYYEALRVEIGSARGQNWWCVLYPSLCFTDATCAVVTEEGQEELTGVLCEDTYETITVTSDNFKIKSFFYELFKERTAD